MSIMFVCRVANLGCFFFCRMQYFHYTFWWCYLIVRHSFFLIRILDLFSNNFQRDIERRQRATIVLGYCIFIYLFICLFVSLMIFLINSFCYVCFGFQWFQFCNEWLSNVLKWYMKLLVIVWVGCVFVGLKVNLKNTSTYAVVMEPD